MSDRIDQSRRRFVKLSAIGIAVTPLVGRVAMAQEKVKESDPTAKALAYVEDATKSTNPKYKKGEACHNCQLYQGKPGEQYGPCPIYGGKLVHVNGWCTAYVPKAG